MRVNPAGPPQSVILSDPELASVAWTTDRSEESRAPAG